LTFKNTQLFFWIIFGEVNICIFVSLFLLLLLLILTMLYGGQIEARVGPASRARESVNNKRTQGGNCVGVSGLGLGWEVVA
jgi:hypothetical protein